MPGMRVKAGIAGMVMMTGTMIMTTQPNNEAQAASCPDLPEVAWWKTNHDKIVNYVEQRYKGKWEPYLNKWRDYRNKMLAIHEKDGTAIVKSRGIRLRGATLKKHIGDVEKRIIVTQCLQEKHGGRLVASHPAHDYPITGAGRTLAGVFRAAKQQALQFASMPDSQIASSTKASFRVEKTSNGVIRDILDLVVAATCRERTPVFTVTNLGDRWPLQGDVIIYQTDGKAMVTKRRLKLDAAEQATFNVNKRGRPLVGEVGVWIKPSWTERPFKYDAKITCRS